MGLHRLKTLPVDLDAMTTSQATDLTDLPAGTADAGFAVDDEGRSSSGPEPSGAGEPSA